MADDKKPSRFEELMRNMGKTKVFPVDLQPLDPAAPLAEDHPMPEREAMQKVSALAARLREVEEGKPAAPFPVEMRKALGEETGLREEDLRQLAPGLLDGKDETDER